MSIIGDTSPGPSKPLRDKCRSWRAPLLFLCMAALLFSAGFVLGHYSVPGQGYATAGTPPQFARQFRAFWEAWLWIEQEFYSPMPLEPHAMTYGSIHGMMAALNDPFTYFAEPSQHRLESDTFTGDFEGIGASLALTGAQPTFVDICPASPADTAGLQIGDRLLAVDGAGVAGLLLDEVALLIRGSLDTPVQVDVQRQNGTYFSATIVRQRVDLPSVDAQLLSDEVGYVGIRLFSARTGEELSRAVEGLQGQHARALVLDLRGNGGGLTGGAIDVLRVLLGHGIAFRELRPGREEQRHAIPFAEPLVDWPLAVLLDGGTASAAEMVAAAIHDYDRGVLIGQRSFGKGAVQSMYQLSDGSSLHITTSHWLSADGYPIEDVGLEPDIIVASGGAAATEDPFLRRAVDYLDEKIGRVSAGSIAPLRSHDSGKVMV
jgi:carboxyl-terminal processing protease